MVQLAIDHLLEERSSKEKGKTAYWLALETGINHGMLWKLRHNKTLTIRLDVIEKLCRALECSPSDLILLVDDKKESKRKTKTKR